MDILKKSFTPNHNIYRHNSFVIFLLHIIFLLVPGIILGHIIDRSVWYLKKEKKLGENNILYILIQIIMNAIIIYILFELSSLYALELQNTLAGIFFVALFFNMQIHFVINLQELFHINSTD